MSKTILVVTGSPRVGGNSDLLAEAFIRGAESAGNSVLRFDAGRENLRGCIDCEQCFKRGMPCVNNTDRFNVMAGMLQKADAVVFCTPLYYYNWPSHIKAAIDRMFCFYFSGTPTPVKETMLIACAEEHDKSAFASLIMNHIQIANVLKWQTRDALLLPGVGAAGSVRQTNGLQSAEAAGRNF